MPVTVQGKLPLSPEEVSQLWQAVAATTKVPDDEVAVRVVTRPEIQRLNQRYHHINQPTNVLTFSYPPDARLSLSDPQHDVALCLEVAAPEAHEQGATLRDYVAWLLVHAFLHATGMDHEVSEPAARSMRDHEQAILTASGFALLSWPK